jgi:formylglycine-generating enzyme required for sulfatase activity
MQACQSSVPGYEGVFDLTGNVREWIDACTSQSGQNDFCAAVGGSIQVDDSPAMCSNFPLNATHQRRDGIEDDVGRKLAQVNGFRCCSDP